MKKWTVEEYKDYLHIEFQGKPGFITIKNEVDGYVVDIWDDLGNEAVGSTYAHFNELKTMKPKLK